MVRSYHTCPLHVWRMGRFQHGFFPNGALYENYVPNRPRGNRSRDPNTNFWIERGLHRVSELGPSQGHYV